MGTHGVPNSKPDKKEPELLPKLLVDIPKIGLIMWILLASLLIPPLCLTVIGNQLVEIPHQRLWVILLGIPIPLVLISLPKRYTLDDQALGIIGWFYRLNIPRNQILSVEPIGTLEALIHPGSLFCSDPSQPLKIIRKNGRVIIISPTNPEPFRRISMNQPNE